MLRYLTAGESHGRCLVAILEGMPAGVPIGIELINSELARRQSGYGRGQRMKIEKDKVEILSGVRKGKSIGSPIALRIENKDFKIEELPPVKSPRPGHADLSGGLKYNTKDLRDVLERASARQTAARVAVGAICKGWLSVLNVEILGHVAALGGVEVHTSDLSFEDIKKNSEASKLLCADNSAEKLMTAEIDQTEKAGDTLGGVFEIIVRGVPAGLGCCAEYDRRLDGKLTGAVMSIQAVKAVEIGAGVRSAGKRGSQVHDQIYYDEKRGFFRSTNNAGGIEGGITNGEDIVVRGYMKPIATLKKPLDSVNIDSKSAIKASIERSDICAVPAAAVVGENTVAFEIAAAFVEKFGGDSLEEMQRNYEGYLEQVKKY